MVPNKDFEVHLMPSMPDLMVPLLSLQEEFDRGTIASEPCALSKHYQMIFQDFNGVKRFTYAKVIAGKVQALAIFALSEPIDGLPCFNVGYAVKPDLRGHGLGVEAVNAGIAELKNGFGRAVRGKSFYLEAVVEVSNQPSIRVAENLFSAPGKPIVDAFSKRPALYFKKLIQF